MWQLTCDGDLLDGKSIWLRPGSQHLLGRTTSKSMSEHVRFIDHKSISRKHLLISIDPVKPGDSTKVHTRSTITLTDSSKSGTFVNGKRLEKSKLVVDKTDNKIQLGTSEYVFHIRWKPVVLSFTNLTKAQKSKADSLEEYRVLLEPADIKLIATYLSGSTTHVVATGRNNPACLQALAQATWTVQYAWVKALMEAVKSDGSELSGLEIDFDGSWPAEKKLIVPSGSEPVPQPDPLLHPNSERSEVFKGLKIIFTNEQQFNNLLPVIVAGGGKAILQEIVASQTTTEQFMKGVTDHVREAKTFRASSELDLSKLVIVRATEPSKDCKWGCDLYADIERRVRKKSILQSAFLNVILTMDTSAMHQPVEEDSSRLPAVESLTPESSQPAVDVAQSSPSAAANSRKQNGFMARRLAAQSRLLAFDDFDPSQITHPTSPSPEPEQPDVDIGEANVLETQRSNKRTKDVNDVMDQHLTGVAALKKRRIETTTVEEPKAPSPVDPFARKPKDKVLDVKAKLLEQRRKEAEEILHREEDLNAQIDGLTVEDMKQFAQHQEFEVVMPKARQGNTSDRQASDRWDPAWNGRRNFKAFRPQGERREEPGQQRVMVTLEPAPVKRASLMEDEYYLGAASSNGISSRNGDRSSVGLSQRDSGFNGRLSYGTDGGFTQTLSSIQTRDKRPLDESTGGRQPKRARNRVTANLDEDDDELQFRRKRL